MRYQPTIRTNLHALSNDVEKSSGCLTRQFMYFFIGLNESSCSPRAFQPRAFLKKIQTIIFKSYHRKTKNLKTLPLFQKNHSFVTVLLLVIGDINYVTCNNTYCHYVTMVITADTPNMDR